MPNLPHTSAVVVHTLWHTADQQLWADALDAYPAVVAAQGVNDLPELDRWYRQDLPARIAARTPPHLEPDELAEVVRWKMKRGEWRARNLALVKGNLPEAVRSASAEAFAAVPDPRKPLAALGRLAGTGPATASAVLAAYRPDLYPFLDDLVARAIPDLGEPKFTETYYLRYAQALRRRAEDLGPPWTAQAIGLALWSGTGGKAGIEQSRQGGKRA